MLARRRRLDLLIRGRAWIGVVAFALIGIVAMQLWLLKLNGGIGRAIEHEGLLQRQNAALSAEDSAMSAGDLVERQAMAGGMTIVPPGALVFLHVRGPADGRLAASRLAQPVQTQGGASTTSTPTAAASTTGAETTSAAPTTAASTRGAEATSAASTTAAPTATTETTPTIQQPEPGR